MVISQAVHEARGAPSRCVMLRGGAATWHASLLQKLVLVSMKLPFELVCRDRVTVCRGVCEEWGCQVNGVPYVCCVCTYVQLGARLKPLL